MSGAPRLGWLVGLVSGAAALGLLYVGRVQAGGWAFPLDDTYIHMAVARNVAETRTWGVNPGEFASASSSPLWTLLLAAGFSVTGVREWLPLAINLAAVLAALAVIDRWFVDLGAAPSRRIAGLSAVSVGAALPVVAGLGMEHVLHLLLALLLAREVVEGGRAGRLAVLGAALPLVRYEGLFEVAVAAGLCVMARRHRHAAVLVGAASAAILAFGAWTLAHGAGFLPNSLVMKGSLGTGFGANLRANLGEGLPAFVVAAAIAVRVPTATGALRTHGLLYLGTAALHLGLASVGWYYRYEAYLLAWGLAWLVVATHDLPRALAARVAMGVGLTAATWLLGARTFDAVRYFPSRCVYIHDVKVVLAESLARTAPGTVLALHDIGAMALYGGARVVDIAGLGTDEVAHLASARSFTGPTIGALVQRRGATLGLATRSWMEADRPPGWTPVAQLEWGLDAERRIEPIVVYEVAPGAAELGRAWLDAAVEGMAGRGSVGAVVQGSGRK